MSAPTNDRREALAAVLAEHFVMWRELDGPIAGEWFCHCGEKFGFSDTAIRHQAAALDAALAAQEGERGGAEVAAVEALLAKWERSVGPASEEFADMGLDFNTMQVPFVVQEVRAALANSAGALAKHDAEVLAEANAAVVWAYGFTLQDAIAGYRERADRIAGDQS